MFLYCFWSCYHRLYFYTETHKHSVWHYRFVEKDNEKLNILIGLKNQYLFFLCSERNNIYCRAAHCWLGFLKNIYWLLFGEYLLLLFLLKENKYSTKIHRKFFKLKKELYEIEAALKCWKFSIFVFSLTNSFDSHRYGANTAFLNTLGSCCCLHFH